MHPSPTSTPPLPSQLSSPPRSPGLDLLRAVAIGVVMLYHLSSHGIDVPGPGQHGWMGVDLFFVLSGYVIAWPVWRDLAVGRTPDWVGFVVGRAWRILPAYLAVLALYVAVPAWREADAMPPLWQFVTFTMNVLPDHVAQRAYSHAWSLCVEQHFYLLFPLVAGLLARRGRMPGVVATAAGAALLFGTGMLLRDWQWRQAIGPHLAPGGDPARAVAGYVRTIYSPTWTRLDGLLAGILLAALRAFRPAWWTCVLSHGWLLLGAGLALLVAATRIDPISHGGALFLYPLVALGCACLVPAALSPRTPLGRQALPGARTLALLSFSLYLTHRQVYAWLGDVAADLASQAPAAAFVLLNGASLAVAALLYVAIERPGLRLRARLRSAAAQPLPRAHEDEVPLAR